MFRRRKPAPVLIDARPTLTPEQLRAYADRMEREAEARRAQSLKLALGELKSGRFRFPMDDTPTLLAHLLERIEALENERLKEKAAPRG